MPRHNRGRGPTFRGAIKIASGKSRPLSRKRYNASLKGQIRRSATKTFGHPTSIKGWKSASKAWYRNNLGCATIMLEAFGIIACIMLLLSII